MTMRLASAMSPRRTGSKSEGHGQPMCRVRAARRLAQLSAAAGARLRRVTAWHSAASPPRLCHRRPHARLPPRLPRRQPCRCAQAHGAVRDAPHGAEGQGLRAGRHPRRRGRCIRWSAAGAEEGRVPAGHRAAVDARRPARAGGRLRGSWCASSTPQGALRQYPGSPLLAHRLLRPQDQLRLFELHPTDHRPCGPARRAAKGIEVAPGRRLRRAEEPAAAADAARAGARSTRATKAMATTRGCSTRCAMRCAALPRACTWSGIRWSASRALPAHGAGPEGAGAAGWLHARLTVQQTDALGLRPGRQRRLDHQSAAHAARAAAAPCCPGWPRPWANTTARSTCCSSARREARAAAAMAVRDGVRLAHSVTKRTRRARSTTAAERAAVHAASRGSRILRGPTRQHERAHDPWSFTCHAQAGCEHCRFWLSCSCYAARWVPADGHGASTRAGSTA